MLPLGHPAPLRRGRFTCLSATIDPGSQSEGSVRPAPPPSAPGARIPRGLGRRAPPWLPREAGLGAGAGAGRRGGVVRPVKIGGGGGRTAHSPQLSGGRSLRTAPAGGCPRQPPASVISSSNAQVSPRSPPPQVGGCCCGPPWGQPRTLAPGGSPQSLVGCPGDGG